MKNLGEKLTEARNAMGLSVRDVADQTRLRIDDIEKMESGEFNINLPEIYRRGFLKIYAAFLKLNVDEVLAEYTALQAARAGGHKPKRLLERIAANSPRGVEPPRPLTRATATRTKPSQNSLPTNRANTSSSGRFSRA